MSRYQKGKPHLDFTEARDNEWQWHQLGHMQVCTSLQTDNHAKISVCCRKKFHIVYRLQCRDKGFAFSALTLLVGLQEGYPARKKLGGEVLAWLSDWGEVQTCIWPS